jgi:glucokinase
MYHVKWKPPGGEKDRDMHVGNRMALIGDIGGTHARFAMGDVDELSVTHFAVFQTNMFSSLQEAVRHYLDSVPLRPQTAGFAVAGDVTGDTITMTKTPWSFTAGDIAAACGVSRIHFVNDFEALALSLPYLTEHDAPQIGGGTADPDGTKLVLGPGSGFGSAALIRQSGAWLPLPGHGGHMSFSATNDREMAILAKLASKTGYAPIHEVLSARGLEAVYSVLAGLSGRGAEKAAAIDIVKRAEKDEDELCEETLDCFASILARIAGDMALAVDARGGVFIGGGMAPKILRTLEKPEFGKQFANKGKRADYLAAIPLHAILANDAGLRGAALAVSEKYPMESLSTQG